MLIDKFPELILYVSINLIRLWSRVMLLSYRIYIRIMKYAFKLPDDFFAPFSMLNNKINVFLVDADEVSIINKFKLFLYLFDVESFDESVGFDLNKFEELFKADKIRLYYQLGDKIKELLITRINNDASVILDGKKIDIDITRYVPF